VANVTDLSSPQASLDAGFAFRRKPLSLAVDFKLTQPWTCLFGASGSGKSTILRILAGFEHPDSGRIVLRRASSMPSPEIILFDSATRTSLRQHRRPVRFMGQQAWLFPGTVMQNITYGMHRRDQGDLAGKLLERLALDQLRDAPVATLSGGERQRVAIARTVAAAIHGRSQHRCLLLLDEPFTGMDVPVRDRLALELRALLAETGVPVLSVTHDVGEVFLLNAEVIRLSEGRILDQGPAERVLAEERHRLQSLLSIRPLP
jgi:molybdate transport system ATP-binding protein